LSAMPHLPPAHYETSKRDSPNETKINVLDSNSNIIKSMTHHTQIKKLTTWFLTITTTYCIQIIVISMTLVAIGSNSSSGPQATIKSVTRTLKVCLGFVL
jgi:hypothetical protein